MTLYAYDLDGTLADTREAVTCAYLCAGVQPPPDFWGRPWRQWLDDEAAHKRKNELYEIIALYLVKPLPLAAVARTEPCIILTGASRPAATAVLKRLNIQPEELHCEMSVEDKITQLNSYPVDGRYPCVGHYYDDDLDALTKIGENTRWKMHLVR